MAGCHCHHEAPTKTHSKKFRNALWIALVLNLSLFLIEVVGGMQSGSASLWADSLDFAGDSFNYIISLIALGMSLYWRANAALLKGGMMVLFAGLVVGKVVWSYSIGQPPEAMTMGVIGVLALLANIISAFVLYTFRDGDSNMRSVWLCSRNDAIGNVAVLLAALGVFGTQSMFPDLLVAFIMAILGFSGGLQVIKQARAERQKSRYTPVH
ncbi:cation transporter [Acinetobacter sp. B5B]|uniref:cation transporter n=1 Tax=Acinetobacter baretiae TaxID=2605383 RepID=UPI0018C2C83A|nr:cation diffusion facilitator family transporter [Acinetobacter baretiae]MBF7681940.1 cation transporter [Acinetobacter baretiae]MBF7685688.1 cation transporter [Acinetobacter baretiae]